jgi:hypothetical protein
MEGQSLIYSFVASGANVLAEYTAFNGNFSTIAVQCLQKLPANNNKFTYTCDHHTFNYLVDDGYSTSLSLSLSFSILLVPRPFWHAHCANAECIVVLPELIRPENQTAEEYKHYYRVSFPFSCFLCPVRN